MQSQNEIIQEYTKRLDVSSKYTEGYTYDELEVIQIITELAERLHEMDRILQQKDKILGKVREVVK